jgi:thiol-disulfide isomerase/thioredoxin
MKNWYTLLLTILLALLFNSSFAQNMANIKQAKTVLTKTLKKLELANTMRYNYLRELRYFEDNYNNKSKGELYFEKDDNSLIAYKFKGKIEKRGAYIFDGNTCYELDDKEKTIKTTNLKNANGLNGNSHLFHSIIMLQKLVEIAITNHTLVKKITDTVIKNKHYYNILIEGHQTYFDTRTAAITPFEDADLKRPYLLIIDKKTYLPYQFVAKIINKTNNKDYMKMTYTNLNLNTPKLPTTTWQYANYAKTYSVPKPEVAIPAIKVGQKLPFFNLPSFEPSKADSVSLTNLLGKTTLIDFWFKSCGPCMISMPHLNELKIKFNTPNFDLISINVEDDIADMEFFYKKLHPNFKMLYQGKIFFNEQLGMQACPTALLIDSLGTVTHIWHGFDQQKMETTIAEVVKGGL